MPAAPPLTTPEKIVRFRTMAEAELARANKAGRLEAQAVHAGRATAAATIALSGSPDPAAAPIEGEEIEDPAEI